MTFLHTQPAKTIHLPIVSMVTRLIKTIRIAFIGETKTPQHILEAQNRREAARDAVNRLLL
jgi:hypothetical protein